MTVNQSNVVPMFNLPISFLKDKYELEKHIITDLELVETKTTKSLYDYVFLHNTDLSSNIWGKQTVHLWSKYYTSNQEFILDSQQLLQAHQDAQAQAQSQAQAHQEQTHQEQAEKVLEIWQEIQAETSFIYKYQYIEYERFEKFNNNATFLQVMSVFNMTSPVLSLIVPILFLIVPFMILKLQGIPITAGMYVSTLKTVFQKHHIGQLFNIKSATWDKAVYILMSFGFYLFQIYQNIMSCIKFFKNMSKIHLQLFTIRDHLVATLEKMENMEKQCKDLKLDTYKPFIADMQVKTAIMREMIAEYTQINPSTSFFSLKKISQVGHLMKCFYQLYNKKEFLDTLQYTFGFNGYLANLTGLCENIKQKNVGKWQGASSVNEATATASVKTKKERKGKKKFAEASKAEASKAEAADAIFKNAYFPSLVNANPVKNSYEMNKHILITGPNAAGKTTILKTTLFNIILSQQVGYGFYETAHFNLYDSIHCYINIPDTSARDSLFQAEARRCKEILNRVMQETNKRHFCVFDELYSGTNPYEAIGSAYAFLTFLTKYPNVNFILTTHFLEVCKRLEKDLGDKIHNYHMQIDTHDMNNFKYLYQLVCGISTIKGGVKVLRDLDYPVEIIDNMNRVLKDIVI